jgi:hypothetical protein
LERDRLTKVDLRSAAPLWGTPAAAMNLAVDDANACGASIEELRLLDCMTM